ncbi:MAG TPA: ABC transporter permease, partial [Beijerinckiaceae bacterium]
MLGFLLRRISIAALVAITVSIIGFALLRLSGDLASVLAGENASPADIAKVARDYGLDRPLWVQYFDWAGGALRGDLGRSLFTSEPVSELILDRIGVTAILAVSALALALLVAVPMGVLAAVKANTWVDRAALVFSVSFQATPNFWLALIFILIFAVNLRWLPVSGSGSPAHFVLPVVTLGLSIMPSIMRLTRAGMMDVLSSDYVRAARAKGLP